jgi:hypothetical protein
MLQTERRNVRIVDGSINRSLGLDSSKCQS